MSTVFRIIDANLNRLREALRVCEEFFRFNLDNQRFSERLKLLRHMLNEIEAELDRKTLLASRDVAQDVFSSENRPEELRRPSLYSVLEANLRRAEEAARVLEEYLKLTESAHVSNSAKKIRFELYSIEKESGEILINAAKEK